MNDSDRNSKVPVSVIVAIVACISALGGAIISGAFGRNSNELAAAKFITTVTLAAEQTGTANAALPKELVTRVVKETVLVEVTRSLTEMVEVTRLVEKEVTRLVEKEVTVEVTRLVQEESVREVIVTPTPPPKKPVATATSNDTSAGTVLEVGEWWKEDDVWLRLTEVEFSDGHMALCLHLWNKSAKPLAFEWSSEKTFSLEDNTGHYYAFNLTSTVTKVVDSDELAHLRRSNTAQTLWSTDLYFFNSSVTDLYLTVSELSRITKAQWHISVPK